MDLISRRAALNTVEKMYKICEGNLSDYHDLLVACFTDLPPAVRWIPCKERLPEMWVSVLVHVLDIPAGNNYTTLRNAVKGYRDALVRKAVSANEYARISGALRAVDEIDSRIEEMLKGVKA